MIIIKKNGYLEYKNLKFRCALGKAGIGVKKIEGDNVTPRGIFKITKIYYRSDKIKNIKTSLRKIEIKKNMGWCDDSNSNFYNKEIKLPSKFNHEKLYRQDNLYDIVAVLDYNMNPVIKSKGSAIFIHIASKSYKKTEGCIALKKKHIIKMLSQIKKTTKIKIY
jgi:L,D-peptidoglycan transpeptidase YkuD (ErfK/YbiS/YcfS/YnhG family)